MKSEMQGLLFCIKDAYKQVEGIGL